MSAKNRDPQNIFAFAIRDLLGYTARGEKANARNARRSSFLPVRRNRRSTPVDRTGIFEIALGDRARRAGGGRTKANCIYRHRNFLERGECGRALDAPSFGRTCDGTCRAIFRIRALSASDWRG